MKNIKNSKKGFTLVELLVVIVILGILAAVAVPSVIGYIDKAEIETSYLSAQAAAQSIKLGLENESIDVDNYQAGLNAIEMDDSIVELTINDQGELTLWTDIEAEAGDDYAKYHSIKGKYYIAASVNQKVIIATQGSEFSINRVGGLWQ